MQYVHGTVVTEQPWLIIRAFSSDQSVLFQHVAARVHVAMPFPNQKHGMSSGKYLRYISGECQRLFPAKMRSIISELATMLSVTFLSILFVTVVDQMIKICRVTRFGSSKLSCQHTLYCRIALRNGKFSRLGGDTTSAPHRVSSLHEFPSPNRIISLEIKYSNRILAASNMTLQQILTFQDSASSQDFCLIQFNPYSTLLVTLQVFKKINFSLKKVAQINASIAIRKFLNGCLRLKTIFIIRLSVQL